MELKTAEWLGRWENFEDYIDSTDPNMVRAWQDAQAAAPANPMFARGVKAFWQMACATRTPHNPDRLTGWAVTEAEGGLHIQWFGPEGRPLGGQDYRLDRVVPLGLEGKANLLLVADAAPEGWPFRCLLAMEPMPERAAHLHGGYLSHLHFQFAATPEQLLRPDGKLANPHWYATMCATDGTLLERCNIVRGLHRLPAWEALPVE